MRGYEDCIAEQAIPDARVIDRDVVVESFVHYRQDFGKKEVQKCQNCVYYSLCEGPWKEYPKLFGWSEFEPVKD